MDEEKQGDLLGEERRSPNARPGESNPFWGKRHTEETRRILSEKAKERTGEANPFFGRQHSEETKEKLRAANVGKKRKPHSEETKRKMSEAQKGRVRSPEHCRRISEAKRGKTRTPEQREEQSRRMLEAFASGERARPVVKSGPESPNWGRKRTEEQRERMRAGCALRDSHRQTEETRGRISAGNVRAIQEGTRTYRCRVLSPCGALVPCRTEAEEVLARHLCATRGVRSVVGEDQMEFIPYEWEGRTRYTVADFLVTRSDGQQVLVEGKDPTSLYTPRTMARIEAVWGWCQERDIPMILAVNGRGNPDVWRGPFVTELFMEGVRARRVRMRTMRRVDIAADAVPSACASPICPPNSSCSE